MYYTTKSTNLLDDIYNNGYSRSVDVDNDTEIDTCNERYIYFIN